MVRRRVSAFLGPALLADERHERDGAEILLLEIGLAGAGDLEQGLPPRLLADRDDEASANGQLLPEGWRDLGPASRHKNGIERPGFGPAFCPVADSQVDVVIAQAPEPLTGRLAE